MDFLTILGGIAFLVTLGGLYLLGIPHQMNFIVFVISYLIQIYIFIETKQWFLILQMITLIVFSIVNFIRWNHKGVCNNGNKKEK